MKKLRMNNGTAEADDSGHTRPRCPECDTLLTEPHECPECGYTPSEDDA